MVVTKRTTGVARLVMAQQFRIDLSPHPQQTSPEHKFPIPHDDCFAALQWVLDNADVLNIDSTKVGVGGDSAGGNLAAGVALRAREEKIALAYQLLIYPATKLDFDTPSYLKNAEGYGLRRRGMMWFWDQYLHPDDKSNPYAVPDVASDHTNLATAIIPTAEYDVLRDDGLCLTLPLTVIYLINLTWLSWGYSDNLGSNPKPFQVVILLGFPAYMAVISIRRTWFKP
jgi:hypothetical protein